MSASLPPTANKPAAAASVAPSENLESFLGNVVSLLSKWIMWFPEDFQDEAMTQKTRKIFQTVIDLQSTAYSARLNQLLSTMTSHLAAMRRHEAWLEEAVTAANGGAVGTNRGGGIAEEVRNDI